MTEWVRIETFEEGKRKAFQAVAKLCVRPRTCSRFHYGHRCRQPAQGLADQREGMPSTRLSADLQRTATYSARSTPQLEHTFCYLAR